MDNTLYTSSTKQLGVSIADPTADARRGKNARVQVSSAASGPHFSVVRVAAGSRGAILPATKAVERRRSAARSRTKSMWPDCLLKASYRLAAEERLAAQDQLTAAEGLLKLHQGSGLSLAAPAAPLGHEAQAAATRSTPGPATEGTRRSTRLHNKTTKASEMANDSKSGGKRARSPGPDHDEAEVTANSKSPAKRARISKTEPGVTQVPKTTTSRPREAARRQREALSPRVLNP